MLHIVLTVLKLIGILIAAILGLLLVIAICSLFVPVRYKSKGSFYSAKKAFLNISWCLKILNIHILYKNNKISYKIRLFGVPIGAFKKNKHKNQKINKKDAKSGKQLNPDKPAAEADSKDQIDLQINEKDNKLNKQDHNLDPIDAMESRESTDNLNSKRNIFSKIKGGIKDRIQQIKRIYNKIKQIITNIRFKLGSIYDKIKLLIVKLKKLVQFIQEEENKEAIKFLKEQLIKVLKHIKPRKIKAKLRFGFEDPALTGKILAFSSMFYGYYTDRLVLIPEPEMEILEGEFYFKGRIRGFTILRIIIKIYRHKTVNQWINKARK